MTVTTLGGIYSRIAGMGTSVVCICYFQGLRKVKLLMSLTYLPVLFNQIFNPVGTSRKELAVKKYLFGSYLDWFKV